MHKILKLVLWSVSLVWMVFFVAFSFVLAKKSADVMAGLEGLPSKLTGVLVWVTPAWVVFTAIMIVWFMALYINKKFGGK